MRLVLLGTTGYHPNDRRQTACFLLPEIGVMLDAGTGVYRAAEYLSTSHLDIFLTHVHLDHVVGLTFLFDVVRAHPLEPIRVHGDGKHLDEVQRHLFAPAIFPARPPFEFVPLAGEVSLPAGGRLSYFPLAHPGDSLGYRLDWPHGSLAYVTDTVADLRADYVERIRGVDLLIHECYFPDSSAEWARTTGHSNITPVAEVARKAGVGRLVLVHVDPFSPDEDPVGLGTAKKIFPRTEIGCDRMVLEVG